MKKIKEINRSQALKIDKDFYVDFDEETELFCVFGDNSGFAYFAESDEKTAYEWCIEIQKTHKTK